MSDYSADFSIRRLWVIFGASMVVMFGALLFFGFQIYQAKPPIPETVRSASGQLLYTKDEIQRGQNVWQSTGGMQQGSIWGHGSYVAPDWSADWLHREALSLRDGIAGTAPGTSFEALPEPDQARFGAMLKREMRTNGYDPKSQVITVSDRRAAAIAKTAAYYSDLFTDGSAAADQARELYAMPRDAVLTGSEAHALGARPGAHGQRDRRLVPAAGDRRRAAPPPPFRQAPPGDATVSRGRHERRRPDRRRPARPPVSALDVWRRAPEPEA